MHEFLTIPAYLLIIAFTLLMKKLSLNEYYEVPIYSAVIVVVINVAAMVVELSNLVLFGAVMGDKFFCFALSMMFVVCVAGYLLVYFHCRERDENTRLQIENKLLESDKMMLQLSDKAVEEMHELFRQQVYEAWIRRPERSTVRRMLEANGFDTQRLGLNFTKSVESPPRVERTRSMYFSISW